MKKGLCYKDFFLDPLKVDPQLVPTVTHPANPATLRTEGHDLPCELHGGVQMMGHKLLTAE